MGAAARSSQPDAWQRRGLDALPFTTIAGIAGIHTLFLAHLHVLRVVHHVELGVEEGAAGGDVHRHVGGRGEGVDDVGGAAALRHGTQHSAQKSGAARVENLV